MRSKARSMDKQTLEERILIRNWGISRDEAERALRNLYAELNAHKFNRELPDNPFLRISLETGGDTATFKLLGWSKVSIYVSPFCEPDRYRRTMVHEMVHYFASGHGEDFRKKLAE